jgi:hypothetical protein
MRSLGIIFLLTALGFFNLNAQLFHGGVLGGFSATQVDGDSYGGYNKAGVQAGVFINTRLSDRFDAQFEIKYTGKGARKPVSSNDPEVYTLSLHYIDVPLLVSAKIKQFASVELGLMPAYLFAAKGEDSGGPLPNDFLVSFRKIDFLFLAGVNIKLLEKFTLNLRYSYSLISIRNLEAEGDHYTWFGRLFGRKTGDYNNCLTMAVYYRIK